MLQVLVVGRRGCSQSVLLHHDDILLAVSVTAPGTGPPDDYENVNLLRQLVQSPPERADLLAERRRGARRQRRAELVRLRSALSAIAAQPPIGDHLKQYQFIYYEQNVNFDMKSGNASTILIKIAPFRLTNN